jgi:hypothetical protein
MIRNFSTQVGGVDFEFLTQHVIRLHGFQVYVLHEGVKVRFHMQVNEEGKLLITDRNSCPAEYLEFEPYLSEAILSSQQKAEQVAAGI